MSASPATPHPHAPDLGWSQRLLGSVHVTGVFWFWTAYWGVRLLPDFGVTVVVALSTTCCFFLLRKIRVAIAKNLEPVLGPCSFWERQRRVFRTMHAFAWCYAERYHHLVRPDRYAMVTEGREHLSGAPGKGLILVTAHIGHWETASHLLSTDVGREAHVVREEELDPKAQAFMRQILGRHGQDRHVTHFASDDPRLAIELSQALQQGHAVALQGDRPRAGSRSLTVSFFGRPLLLPIGPAALARATGVSLVPVFIFRNGKRRYRVCAGAPIQVAREGDRVAAVAAATRRLAAEIEAAIREQPHQWFCFRQLWP